MLPLSYIYWYMRSYEYHMNIVASATGSTVKHTSPIRILEQYIPVPDMQDIKNYLAIFENINAIISRNNSENFSLCLLREKLLPKLMSGELDVSELDI